MCTFLSSSRDNMTSDEAEIRVPEGALRQVVALHDDRPRQYERERCVRELRVLGKRRRPGGPNVESGEGEGVLGRGKCEIWVEALAVKNKREFSACQDVTHCTATQYVTEACTMAGSFSLALGRQVYRIVCGRVEEEVQVRGHVSGEEAGHRAHGTGTEHVCGEDGEGVRGGDAERSGVHLEDRNGLQACVDG